MKIKYAFLISIPLASASFCPFSISAEPPPNLQAIAIQKYSFRANSGDKDKVIPLGVFYQIVLRQTVHDRSAWGLFSNEDAKVLLNLHAPQSKFFVKRDVAEIVAICGAVPRNPTGTDIMNVAGEFATARDQSEQRLETYYRKEVEKLSLAAQQYIEARIEDLKNSRQVGYGSIDIQGMAAEFPDVAYDLLEEKCSAQNVGGQDAELKNVYFANEDLKYSAMVEE